MCVYCVCVRVCFRSLVLLAVWHRGGRVASLASLEAPLDPVTLAPCGPWENKG